MIDTSEKFDKIPMIYPVRDWFGVMGGSFQSPFATPPGEGLSSACVNVLWGAFNFAVAYGLLARVGQFQPRRNSHALVFAVGALGMALMLAKHFGKFLGNTAGPGLPFVGLVAQTLARSAEERDDAVGRPVGAIFGKFAIGEPPAGSTGGSIKTSANASWVVGQGKQERIGRRKMARLKEAPSYRQMEKKVIRFNRKNR